MRPPLTLRELASRKNSLMFGLTVAATALFAGWLVYAAADLMRIYHGPEPVTLTELLEMGPEAAGSWFSVTADDKPVHMLQTTYTSRRTGGATITNHFALIRSKALFVETSQSQLPATFFAWASEFGEGSSYFRRAKTQLEKWALGRNVSMASLLLKTSPDVSATRWLYSLGIAFACIVLTFLLIRNVRHVLDYTRTPALRQLRKSVRGAETIPRLIAEIDSQLARRDPNASRFGLIFLPSWLLNVQPLSLLSSVDFMWVVPYETKMKPFSRAQSQFYVFDRNGRAAITFNVTEDREHETLMAFYHWAPWAIIGPDPAMELRFGKATRFKRVRRMLSKQPSRAELVATVDKRRQEILAAWAAQEQAQSVQAPPIQHAQAPRNERTR